jgi:REP element-mobilizing transposase RayT
VHKARYPLHVTVRMRGALPSLRERGLAGVTIAAITAAHDGAFRVLHFSIQVDHIHLIVEAHDSVSLARGMQGLNVRIARSVNGILGIRGPVWRERYHARRLETPREVRNAIVYVLMSSKKHGRALANGVDALSSAPFFDGFAGVSPTTAPSPVRAPRTWLAGVGWRRRGLIRANERPS